MVWCWWTSLCACAGIGGGGRGKVGIGGRVPTGTVETLGLTTWGGTDGLPCGGTGGGVPSGLSCTLAVVSEYILPCCDSFPDTPSTETELVLFDCELLEFGFGEVLGPETDPGTALWTAE